MPNPNKRATDHRPADVTPACLEVNRKGGWVEVIRFDLADTQTGIAVQRSALTLARLGGGIWRLRMAAAGGYSQVLAVLNDTGLGWEALGER